MLACLSWASCTTTPVATDCHKFKAGTFTVRHLDPKNGFSYLISRRNNIQIETDQQTGDVSELAIKWTGPCSYELQLLRSTKHFSPAIEAMRRELPLKVEIIGYTDTYCLFQSHRTDDDPVYTDTLWIKK